MDLKAVDTFIQSDKVKPTAIECLDERMVLQLPARPPSFVPERRIPLTAWSI